MSKRGFVYVLGNEHMPDVYKVGCTERSPHERAAEISNATGVPSPFDVLCYIEVEDFQTVERHIHKWAGLYRISPSREFFKDCLDSILRWMWHCPYRLSFCDATLDLNGYSRLLVEHLFIGEFSDLENPWTKAVVEAPPIGDEIDDSSPFGDDSPELRLVSNGEAASA